MDMVDPEGQIFNPAPIRVEKSLAPSQTWPHLQALFPLSKGVGQSAPFYGFDLLAEIVEGSDSMPPAPLWFVPPLTTGPLSVTGSSRRRSGAPRACKRTGGGDRGGAQKRARRTGLPLRGAVAREGGGGAVVRRSAGPWVYPAARPRPAPPGRLGSMAHGSGAGRRRPAGCGDH